MDIVEVMKKVRKIELKMKGQNTQIFSGEYHSAFKGRGMSFSEVREYSYGDDVRNIEWNVSARANTPYVKIFEEERELTVMLLIDVSASMTFATSERSKRNLVIEIAAVLGFSALANNDKIGAILFSDQVEQYIPPQKGRKNVLRLIRELLVNEPKNVATNIGKAFDYLNNVQKKRCITFLISDFKNDGFERSLSLSARKQDLIGVQVLDPAEQRLIAGIGMIKAIDPENGSEMWIDTNDKQYVNAYNSYIENGQKYLETLFKKQGARFKALNTNDDYIKSLIELFKR